MYKYYKKVNENPVGLAFLSFLEILRIYFVHKHPSFKAAATGGEWLGTIFQDTITKYHWAESSETLSQNL